MSKLDKPTREKDELTANYKEELKEEEELEESELTEEKPKA